MTITSPSGFVASGIAAGIKQSKAADLALLVNTGPCSVGAGVFTSNRVVAAPVVWTRDVVSRGSIRAVVLNSGGANACTGPEGLSDAEEMAQAVAAEVDVPATEVAVCSTGLIGERLPMPVVKAGIAQAAQKLSDNGGADAALAIMTTDSVPKVASASGNGWSIGGMAKGAGMLAPGLATMLSVVTTDAVLTTEFATKVLPEITATTFDRVDSDGCMSTNDCVLLLASGASGVAPREDDFVRALREVCAQLSRALVADAEGASHDIAVRVVNASSETAAVAVARAVTRSNLFKAAIFGNDPNWGRVLSAIGTVPVEVAPFDPARLDVSINGVQVCRAGGVGEDRSGVDIASQREVHVVADLHEGTSEATVWTNDLTYDYVTENSAYST